MWGCHFSALKRQKALIGRYNSDIGFIPSTHLNLPLIRPLSKELCYYCSFGPKTCAATHARTRAIASAPHRHELLRNATRASRRPYVSLIVG
ncbi:unnamed protein product [Anisakis simplex]|uniref:Uncharacterized protein n=1 Tax=Anisakis simplex TaxID=6269 RepID=A0A0M3KEN6_ANISI|nr:unnamed protein product [Anisakis simplex]